MARAKSVPESSSRRPTLVIGLLVALVAAAVAWWFWPTPSRVSETAAIATNLLDAGGKPDRRAIRQLVAEVDRMPRDELRQLWREVGDQWRRLRQDAIDRYFTAPASEKPQLLDAEIERLEALRELMVALNPQAEPGEPPRMPREQGRGRRGRGDEAADAPSDGAARQAEAARLAIARRYEEALATHAKARGVRLPTFR